jgi:hypothetical protein
LNTLGVIFLGAFLGFGGVMILVYSQMSRDATLSHITNTKIGLLTTLFPSITDFALSWLQPGLAASK